MIDGMVNVHFVVRSAIVANVRPALNGTSVPLTIRLEHFAVGVSVKCDATTMLVRYKTRREANLRHAGR